MTGHLCSGARHDLVEELIEGMPVESQLWRCLADCYVIAVLKPYIGPLESISCPPAAMNAMYTYRDGSVVLLLPDVDPESTRSAIERLTACLPAEGWVAVAHRPVDEIADGYREAADTAHLLQAGQRPSGTYRMTDVLVEYAATRDPAVVDRLASIISPLSGHPVLRETLTVWIDADRNRSQAAKRLFVHRNTLNYRLGRVAEITGLDPTTGRGVQQLAIAMIAESIRGA